MVAPFLDLMGLDIIQATRVNMRDVCLLSNTSYANTTKM